MVDRLRLAADGDVAEDADSSRNDRCAQLLRNVALRHDRAERLGVFIWQEDRGGVGIQQAHGPRPDDFEHRRLSHWPGWRRCTLASVTTLTFDGDRLAGVTYAEPAAAALLGPAPAPDPPGGRRPGPEEGLRPEREPQ